MEGHAGTVNSVSFSPDMGRIASGSEDESIRVWDVTTGDCLATLEGHSGSARSVMFFPDGHRLASGSFDHTIRIWDLSTAACVTVLEAHSNWVSSVSLSPDGSRIASASDDQTIRIWNISDETNPAALVLKGHTNTVTSAVFSSTGGHIASGSDDKTVRLWDAATGESVVTFTGHTHWVRSVDISPNGRYIVSGSDDDTVKIWDASAVHGNATEADPSPSSEVMSIAFSPDGTRIASVDRNELFQVRDVVTGHIIASFNLHAEYIRHHYWQVGFSLHNSQIILHADSENNSERVPLDASNGDPITRVEVLASDIYRPQTPLTVKGGKLLRHDVSPPTTVCILPHFLPAITSSAFSEPIDGTIRVAIGCQDGRILILHVRL